MVTVVDTEALEALVDADVPLVEVLPAADFEEERLPGATSIPLGSLTAEAVAHLDATAPVVVYGFDYQDDRSARAARLLERLGFTDVYDYAPGKVAWLAKGLASEGARRPEQRVASIADPEVVRIPANSTAGDAAALLDAAGNAEFGVVLDDAGIVLGLLRREATGLDPATAVRDLVQPAPSTFRPSMTIKEMIEYFHKSDEARALITTLDGQWIGLIRRSDVIHD